MSALALGRRYAGALLELAMENNALDAVRKDVAALRSAWEGSEELRQFVRNPSLPRALAKQTAVALLDRIGAHTLTRNTVAFLADRGRLAQLPDVLDALDLLAEARSGQVRAEVTVAVPMPDTYYDELRRKLEAITKTRVVLDKKEDPSLIGGVVARVGDLVFDGSLKNRLDELKETLLADGP